MNKLKCGNCGCDEQYEGMDKGLRCSECDTTFKEVNKE